MSEKTVNIKITASTKEFDNAIKKAQKQIENLAGIIDKLGSDKFGNKLEEQFDNLAKAAERVEEKIANMLNSLDDLGKTKLSKVEDELDDINEAGEKLNDTLDDTTNSIEDLDKSKFSKLEDQFKDIIDSGKDFNEKVEDIIDLLDEVDRQDLNGLETEFDQVRDALERIRKETSDSTNNMEEGFREVTDEVNKFIRELNNIEDTKLENLEESFTGLDRYVDEATESIDKFNNETNELNNEELDKYLESLIDVTRAGENVQDTLKKAFSALDGKNTQLGINISGKDKDGLLSNITDGLISGTVAGNKLEKAMENVADSIKDVADNMDKLNNALDTDSIDELGEEYKEAEKAMEKLTEEYNELIKKQEKSNELKDAMEFRNDEYKKTIQPLIDKYKELQEVMSDKKGQLDKRLQEEAEFAKEYAQGMEILNQKIPEVTNAIEEQKKVIDQVGKEYDEATDKVIEASEAIRKMEDAIATLEVLGEPVSEYKDELESAKKFLEQLRKEEEALGDEWTKSQDRLDALNKELEEYNDIAKELEDGPRIMAELREESEKYAKELEELEKRAEGVANQVKELKNIDISQDNELQKLKEEMQEAEKAAEGLQNQMKKTADRMAEINKVAQGHANEFDKQYKAYEKLSKSVKAYLEDEEKSILLREKVAKSFREVSNAMEAVYKDSSKLNNFDLVNKTLEEAAEHIKDLNLVSTENLQADLKRLGEIIEDKTEKIKRFKELNKEFGSDASKQAYGIEQQAQAIRDWANKADFAIEAAETLTNAWGDLSAAGEDHLKIRERSKYIEDYGKALEENVAHIRNYYHELETLDEIYKECTDVQKGIIDDYRIWEKNKDALLEYNRAINDYLRSVRDSGGEIDSKFLNELGKFDPQKFIDNFEKMGASSVVLSKQINAVKIELTESIKQYKENAAIAKENAEQAVRNAEAALEEAKANKKNAESKEEYREATERVKKAQEELAEAKRKAKNYDEDNLKTLKEQIQEYNRLAKAMREIGMAAQDLGKSDIEKFNKSLAAMLDNLGTFENDLPKTFSDLGEDIKAVFLNMDSLDFSGIFDGLKDVAAGALSMIPDELKIAAAAAWALEEALRACANAGIEQLGQGIDTIKSALSGLVDIARDVAQEIFDAFENITGMQLDLSSMIELPINFEAQMAKVGAIAGATGDDFDRLEAKARELGASTLHSATEVAEAMEYMGMAGWTTQEIIDGLAGVLDLATVSGMDLGQASDFVTDGLTAFGMKAGEASKMVDWLATASTKSNTSVAQMQRAFSNCASVADSFEVDMQDLITALGLMANQGVKGAKAGTAMKNLITNLNTLTKDQAACVEEYNLQAAREAIINGDLLGGLKLLKTALEDLDTPTKNAVIETLVGKEALNGVSALLGTTEKDLRELDAAMSNCTGSAREMAGTMEATLASALDNLGGAIEERLLQIFDKTKDGIKDVVIELTEFINIWNGLSEGGNGSGLADALTYLEKASRGWGESITKGITEAMKAIDDFINNGSLDNVLQIGTNIINGIADGIKKAADDGTLGHAITTAIRKIATWFADNLDTVVEVGKEIIEAISKGISENSDEIGEVIKAVMEMQTEIDKAIAKEKWKLIGQNLISFICEGIVSKVSVFVSAFTGFFSGCIGDIANAFSDLIVNKLSPMLIDPIAILGESIGNFLKEVLLSALERAFDIDLSYFKDFNIFNPSSWFGDKDKKDTSNKKSNSSNKGKKDTGSSTWDSIKKELESWGKAISDWGTDVSGKIEEAWINLTSKFSKGGKDTSKSISTSWSDIKKELDNWGKGISNWGKDVGSWFSGAWDSVEKELNNWDTNISNWGKDVSNEFSNAWDSVCDSFSNWGEKAGTSASNAWNSTLETLSSWKTGIADWGTEMGEELSKTGDGIKTFFTETLPKCFDPEVLGSTLGTLTGTIARETVDAFKAFDAWGEELYNKGSEAAIKYSNGIRDFFIELPGNISTWVSDAWSAVDEWGNNLYIKGSEAAIKYSDGIRDFFIELPGKVSTWLTSTSESFIQWSYDLYNRGTEAASNFILGIGEGFVNLCNDISNWLTQASEAIIQWTVDMYNKGTEAATNFVLGIGEGFVNLCESISNWLTEASEAIIQWTVDLYSKGKEAATNFVLGVGEGFTKLCTDITNWLSDATKAVTKWCKDLYTKGKEAVNNFIKGLAEGFTQLPNKITSWLGSGKKAVTNWGNDVKKSASSAGKNIVNGIFSGMSGFTSSITTWCNKFKNSFVSSFKKAFGIHSPSTVMRDEVGVNLALGIEEGLNSGSGSIAQTAGNIVNTVKNGLGNVWGDIFSGNISDTDLLNISTEGIDQASMGLKSLSVTLTATSEVVDQASMAFKLLSMTLSQMSETLQVSNAAFMSLGTSFANVSAITDGIRTAFMSIANIITNQVTNARNALTSQFLSMAAVARTQMVNISNIIRNQATTWYNIINNQAKNARNAFTSQMISMAKVAATQMNKVVSSVRSSMSQVSSATSRGITMNVSRNVSTGYSLPSANALYAANNASTYSIGNNTGALYSNASYAAPSGSSSSSGSSRGNDSMVIEVPLYLDGKVVARATAKYIGDEIQTMNKRENRKRGAK